jgi:AcrR family transcriptional regulator
MNLPVTKSEATLTGIVETACQLAAADGIGKLSLGDVAKHMGISKSGVFARVGSLIALQHMVLDEYDRSFVAEVLTPSLQLPKGLPRLNAQLSAWINRASDPGARTSCLYTAGAFEFDDRQTPLRDRLHDGVTRWRASLRRTIEQAIDAGHLRPDTDPEQLVFELSSLIVGLMHDVRFMRNGDSGRRMHGAVARVMATYRSLNWSE